MPQHSTALDDYVPAFADPDEPFLTYYSFRPDRSIRKEEFTRGKLWSLALKTAHVLRRHSLGREDCFAQYLSANRPEDLAFRLGATMVGAVPVTLNWQADTLEQIAYKVGLTEARLVVADGGSDQETVEAVMRRFPDVGLFHVKDLAAEPQLPPSDICRDADLDDGATKIIIFTSGTTGQPKGVRLSYRSYVTNRRTFESFLKVGAEDHFAAVVVNPMHHTNSTAITDWALRRPGSRLHLIERYSTQYWGILVEIAQQPFTPIVAPAVSRHFDFLANLERDSRLPVPLCELREAMGRVNFLIGSAPVGPTTVRRLQEYAGRLPTVRFGSTETCLQVMGTPVDMPEEQKLAVFRRGWAHYWKGEQQPGYYVGRPHPPHTEVRVVRSTKRNDKDYFVDCVEGEPGYLITRGSNLMLAYVKDDESTKEVMHDSGWYTGLHDICFWLANDATDERDYYWLSRDSALLIRGGANYAYAQINAELKSFVAKRYALPQDAFDVAVVGLRLESEHEDDCCVTVELISQQARDEQPEMDRTFLTEAPKSVSKGARPDRVRFAPIPRNFKGAILIPELRNRWLAALGEQSADCRQLP